MWKLEDSALNSIATMTQLISQSGSLGSDLLKIFLAQSMVSALALKLLDRDLVCNSSLVGSDKFVLGCSEYYRKKDRDKVVKSSYIP